VIDGKTVEVDFLDELGAQAVAAFFVAADAEVRELDAPESSFGVSSESGVRRFQEKCRLALGVFIDDVGGCA